MSDPAPRGAARPGRAPGPLLVLGAAAIVLAFAGDHPLVLAALAAGAGALVRAAPTRLSRLFLVGGAVSGGGLVVLTPLVASEGDLILVRGPALALIDLEVTVEELAAGLAAGARVALVALLVGALLAHVDPDRLQSLASRLAPRSALVMGLAARLVPTLERDARAIAEAARLRGLDLAGGSWPARARRAAPLAVPLVGTSLERGLDAAEAMAARGYGSGPRTRLPEPRLTAPERAVLVLGVGLALAAAAALVTGAAGYAYYPTLVSPLSAGAAAVAAVAAGGLIGAAAALRR